MKRVRHALSVKRSDFWIDKHATRTDEPRQPLGKSEEQKVTVMTSESVAALKVHKDLKSDSFLVVAYCGLFFPPRLDILIVAVLNLYIFFIDLSNFTIIKQALGEGSYLLIFTTILVWSL